MKLATRPAPQHGPAKAPTTTAAKAARPERRPTRPQRHPRQLALIASLKLAASLAEQIAEETEGAATAELAELNTDSVAINWLARIAGDMVGCSLVAPDASDELVKLLQVALDNAPPYEELAERWYAAIRAQYLTANPDVG